MIGFVLNVFKKNIQFIKFGLIGLSNTLISYVIYALVVSLSIHYQIANVLAFIVSSLSGFLFNRAWVFYAKQGSLIKQLFKYYVVYGSSLVLGMVLSFFWIEIIGVNVYFPPLINLFITVPYNFLLNKLWAFKPLGIHGEKTVKEQF